MSYPGSSELERTAARKVVFDRMPAEIIDEPYSGDDQHDSALRKAKIAAANALLSADVDDVYRLERMIG